MPVKWWFVIRAFMVLLFRFFLGLFLGGKKGLLIGPKPGSGASSNRSNTEFVGVITNVADGYTLDIDGRRIRLALPDPPGIEDPMFVEAIRFTSTFCPVGSKASVDMADSNPVDDLGRTLGVVYCGDKNLKCVVKLAWLN